MTDLIPRRTAPVTGHRAAPGRGCERPLASRPHGRPAATSRRPSCLPRTAQG
jgi:hypothetical protein